MPGEIGVACHLPDSRFASLVSVVHLKRHESHRSCNSGACEGQLKIESTEWPNENARNYF